MRTATASFSRGGFGIAAAPAHLADVRHAVAPQVSVNASSQPDFFACPRLNCGEASVAGLPHHQLAFPKEAPHA
ncbi:hypothetical protein [Nonomuraea sp. LPB2021202275-12-8]|uniref:hypothetical protein n=1 Tax=Nonomuraea sp. LPB2021202275-12-8 TaxID=3120159 RepID=UPI00300CB326